MSNTWVNPLFNSIRGKLLDSADSQSAEIAFHNDRLIHRNSEDLITRGFKVMRRPANLTMGAFALLFLLITLFGYGVHPVQAAAPAAPLGKDVLQATICSTQTSLPLAECEALVALYNQTNGASWTNHTGWLASNTPCTWYGVTCTSGHVTRVTLNSNGLNGTLPTELGNLPYLERLSLSSNHLSGSIPASLGGLTRMQTLQMNKNVLTGFIPTELGNMTALRSFELNSNQLSGSIPLELGNLTNLTKLLLSENLLSGSIPASIGSLANLQTMNLGSNQLTGAIPPELGNLDNLTAMSLSTNQLSGSIPAALGNMARIQTLQVYGNVLSGSIPAELGNLTSLRVLEVYGNQLTGIIPPQLGNLVNATNLLFGHNLLSGPVPSELGNLANLVHLSFVDNPLTGSIPLSYINLTHLSIFRFYATSLCEPTSAEFIGWKATVPTWLGTSSCYSKVSPADGQAIQSVNLDLTWEAMSPATSYEYCYDTSNDNSCSAWINNGLNTTAALSNLSIDTTYYWQVRAKNGSSLPVESNGGVWWSFAIMPTSQGGFGKTSPANNAANQPINLTLTWSSAGAGITYEYCVTQAAPFDCSGSWLSTAATSVEISGLANSSTYYWQVRGLDGSGNTVDANAQDANPIWQFSTRPVPPSSSDVIYNDVYENQIMEDDLPGANQMTFALTGAQPAGALSLSPEGHFIYQPPLNFGGQIQFQFTVTDGINDPVGPYTVTINYVSVNDAPVALDDSYIIGTGAVLSVDAPGVLGNDSDADSPALTAVLSSGPANGALTLNPNGSFQYQPNPGFSGIDTFTYQASDGQAGSNTALVTLTVTSTNRIFEDGFESGTLGGWTANVNDGGDLSAASNAAMVGSYGMQAVIDDNNAIYVTDDSPNAEKRYRARFYFDPNSLVMGSSDKHRIFVGYAGTSTMAFELNIRRSPSTGVFSVRIGTYTDAGVPVATPWTDIVDDRQSIEIDWQAASGAGANNGSLNWWIDGAPQVGSSGIDNDTRQIDRVRLGTVTGVSSGTRGVYFFDDYISDRDTYIGPAQ